MTFIGIHIDSINYKQYNISGLYIKLDKKLILEASDIKITSKAVASNNIEQVKKHIMSLPVVLKYFQKIDITNLQINDNNLYIKFDTNKFYFNSDNIYVEARPKFSKHNIKIFIQEAIIKQYNINIDGQINIDTKNNNFIYTGNVKYKNQALRLNIKGDKKFIDLDASSGDLSNISLTKDFIKLDSAIEKWLYTYVKGIHNLDSLRFKYDIENSKIVKNSIKLNTNVKDALVYFKDNLKPVKVSNINIKYHNNKLLFKFKNPIYKATKLDGSSLYIDNIDTDKRSNLYLNLKSKARLNSDIGEILKAYDINLDLTQESGSLDTDMNIKIDLSNDNIDINGTYKIQNSDLRLGKLNFYIKSSVVKIHNNIVDIKANRVLLLDEKLDINLDDFKLNTKTNTAVGEIFVNKFKIDDDLIDIQNIKSAIYIDFKSNPVVNIPNFSTIIEVNDGFTSVEFNDIEKYNTYSKLIRDNGLNQGNISLEIKKDNKMNFIANITKLDSPLMIDNVKLIGNIDKNHINIYSSDKKIKLFLDEAKTNIFIDGIDINKSKIKTKIDSNPKNDLKVEAINSNIILEDGKKLLSDKFIYINRVNGDIDFDLNYSNTTIAFKTVKNSSTINIIDANKIFINSFMGNDDFISSGNVNIYGKSNKDDKYVYSGELSLKDTNFQDFAALNNILTMIQSSSAIANPLLALPTLFRMVKGDIKLNGYMAIDGTIKYAYNHENKFLNLHNIQTKGAEIDFDGSAIIDLDKRTINSELKVIFLKDIVNIGSKIPIVNLLVNKKNKIYSTISINGKLEDPETKFILFNP